MEGWRRGDVGEDEGEEYWEGAGTVSCEGAITAGGRKGTTGDNEGFVFDEEIRREEYRKNSQLTQHLPQLLQPPSTTLLPSHNHLMANLKPPTPSEPLPPGLPIPHVPQPQTLNLRARPLPPALTLPIPPHPNPIALHATALHRRRPHRLKIPPLKIVMQ